MMKKRFLYIILSLLLLSYGGWYLWPYVACQWFLYKGTSKEFRQYLSLQPIYTDTLLSPPKKWPEIKLGDMSFKIPLADCQNVDSLFPVRRGIDFTFKKGSFNISIHRPGEDDFVRYEDLYKIFHAVPSDISVFNKRGQNEFIKTALYFKGLMSAIGEYPYAIDMILTDTFKAFCFKEGLPDFFSAVVYAYNLSESIHVQIGLHGYESKDMLEKNLYQILGGIHIPDTEIDMASVEKDIQRIVRKFKE